MAGATAVGISGGAILHGLTIFDKIHDDLIKWMLKKGYSSLSDFRSLANKSEIYEVYHQKASINQEVCVACGLCVKSCFQQAIEKKNNKFIIDQSLCVGCGVCESVCIANAITLK
jgi:Pyruvate/2-oxoacid:ferredoxin oxidoreductase delta subunit